MKKSTVVLLVIGFSFLTTFYTNCGSKFSIKDMSSISSDSLAASATLEAASISVVVPKLTETGKCSSEINISINNKIEKPIKMIFPATFKNRLYKDSFCTNPAELDMIMTANELPLKLYVLSHELFQDEFYVKVEGSISNSQLITVYRSDFTNVDTSSLGALYLNNPEVGSTKAFVLSETNGTSLITTDVFSPNLVDVRRGNSNESGFLAAVSAYAYSTKTGVGMRIAFNDRGVYYGVNKVMDGAATSISYAVQWNSVFPYSCVSMNNKVYCSDGETANYRQIFLPEGNLTDLRNTLTNSTCAAVSGRVYCWNPDGAHDEVTDLGNDVLQIAVNNLSNYENKIFDRDSINKGRICVLRSKGGISCLLNGTKKDFLIPNVVRIESGVFAKGFLAVKKRTGRVESWSLLDVVNGDTVDFSENVQFDDFAFLPLLPANNLREIQGCGRSLKKLICFKATGIPLVITSKEITGVTY